MADLQEKKDKFSSAINHYAEEQREKIENEIEDYKRKELEEAEIEVLTECYQLIQKETQGMRNGIAREMAQREMDARRDLLPESHAEAQGIYRAGRLCFLPEKVSRPVCQNFRPSGNRCPTEVRR